LLQPEQHVLVPYLLVSVVVDAFEVGEEFRVGAGRLAKEVEFL
jgi:hypothetical protein